jgi:hypothetical protein
MVITIDETSSAAELQAWSAKVREKRLNAKRPTLAKYFGAMPDIGDGLTIQKALRNEWNNKNIILN